MTKVNDFTLPFGEISKKKILFILSSNQNNNQTKMEDAVISKSLIYKSAQVVHGTYKNQRLTQQSGSPDVTINGNGGNVSIFEIAPSTVLNFSKSSLSFVATPSARRRTEVSKPETGKQE